MISEDTRNDAGESTEIGGTAYSREADTPRPAYVYVALPCVKTDIRLLVLHPAVSSDAPIHGELTVGSLNSVANKYEALSYTWGSDISSEPLHISGSCLKLGQNLCDALRRLRYRQRPRALWIDAICINQRDDAEKTAQIKIMGQIYASAKRVTIWLGEDSEHEDGKVFIGVATELNKITRHRPSSVYLRWLRQFPKIFLDFFGGKRAEFVEDLVRQQSGGRLQLTELTRMFYHRGWFRRRWVIQELLLSKKAIMICGNHELDVEKLLTLVEPFHGMLDYHNPDPERLLEAFGTFRKHRRISSADAAHELLEFMERFSNFQCRDDRDLLAAVLGIRMSSLCSFSVDYSLSAEQNYIDFAKMMISSGFYSHMLLEATSQVRPRAPGVEDVLPSWVPDWRAGTLRIPTVSYTGRMWLEDHVAAFYPERISAEFGFNRMGKLLVVLPFIVVDTIAQHRTPAISNTKIFTTTQGLEVDDLKESNTDADSIQLGDILCFLGEDISAAVERYCASMDTLDQAIDGVFYVLRRTIDSNEETFTVVGATDRQMGRLWSRADLSRCNLYSQRLKLI